MKKKLLSLAIVAAIAPGFATAADVSGFADIIYTIADDANKPATGTHPTEGKFSASGEVDFSASPADGVTTRIDVDLSLDPSADNSGAAIEQAFFAWGVTEGVTVIGGVFNNPIGHEAEDAPDMNFTTHGAVYNVLDGQTALDGDNVAGLAVAGAVGPVTLTGAFLNDIGQTNEENSLALVANYSPLKGLDLELGFVTQADQTKNAGSAEDVTNFNVAYSPEQVAGLTVGLDYLTAGKIVDAAYDAWIGYSYEKFGAKIRLSDISYTTASAIADADATTIYLSYQAAKNLAAAIEFRTDGATGAADRDTTQLELIATF